MFISVIIAVFAMHSVFWTAWLAL